MFRALTPEQARDKLGLRAAGREQLLTLQWLKLVNLFGDRLCDQWGGDHLHHQSIAKLKDGLQCFLYDFRTSRKERQWVHLDPGETIWSPSTAWCRTKPSVYLGHPFEPYLSCRGGVTTMASACKIFEVTEPEFFEMKCLHVIDRHLIDALINQKITRSLQ